MKKVMRLTEADLNRLVKKVINENEDTSMDEYINYDIKSVDCQDSSLDDDYWRGSMYVREDEDGNPLVVIRYCKGDDEELNRLKRKARHYMEKSNQLPSDNESIFENKKVVRLTESDLNRLVKRVIREQYNDEEELRATLASNKIENISSDDELKRGFELYKNKMDKFLDELKSSGTEIDGQRFLTQVRNQTNQIYFDVDEISDSTPKRFSEFQLELFKHFRDKLK
jgi:exonuclease VII large subunit